MLKKGMFLADRYEILEHIGAGGMSDVYKAKCHKLNRFVAIKVLKKEYSEDRSFVSKFRIEAQSAAGLAHPNIVNVYDVGDENGIYYIVMELVEGITLKQYIEKKEKLPYKEAVSIAIQVAKGIDAAHRHHIIHRDIKPHNIIISKDGKVKVTDFGIAKAATSSTINSSAAMGSVHYISPEQARIGYSDERSDIYSFGITFFEMLTGKVPYDGDTTVSVAVQHIQNSIPAPSTLADDIPISIDKIALKCTQKKSEFRYQNATELIEDLKKALVMPDEDFVNLVTIPGTNDEAKDTEELSGYNNDDILDDGYDADDELAEDLEETDEESEDDNDIDDESNDKLDKAMKWIGVGIVIVIILVSIFMVIKLVGSSSSKSNEQTTEQVTEETKTKDTDETTKSGTVKVPSVSGMTEEKAKETLNSQGLGFKPSYVFDDTVEEGKVVSQSPAAGKSVDKNETIVVKISKGPEEKTSTVPDVYNKSEADASSILSNAGFNVSVDYKYSDTIEAGNVISQTPSANSSAVSGTTVTIVVSRGKEVKMSPVPKLVGLDEGTARQQIEASGFKAEVKYVNNDTVTQGCVISQNQPEGSQYAQGTTITIYVSTGPRETKTTEETKSSDTGDSDKTGSSSGNAQ